MMQIAHMEIHERLQQARKSAKYTTPADAAQAMGVTRVTYYQHESGIRGITRTTAERYANFFRVDLTWLLTGKGRLERKGLIPVLGYVGAGAEIYPVDDHAQGGSLDTIEATVYPEDAVAVRIRGDSMYPFEEGWTLIYRKDRDGVPSACINQLCVCKVAHDGPMFIKRLRKGTRAKHYNLESWNAAPREDVELEWASPVLAILPR
tara:strand:+ start:5112 stop:5729 length:618 start_codon:yes stop_codon:yes gene_type:complete